MFAHRAWREHHRRSDGFTHRWRIFLNPLKLRRIFRSAPNWHDTCKAVSHRLDGEPIATTVQRGARAMPLSWRCASRLEARHFLVNPNGTERKQRGAIRKDE
jgi:hypothetical protein